MDEAALPHIVAAILRSLKSFTSGAADSGTCNNPYGSSDATGEGLRWVSVHGFQR
jgi:hypothetical protein